MRLTLPLFLFKTPKGSLFRGKYRLVKPVTAAAMDKLRMEWQLEEQNMLYLRHPYLTTDESICLKEVEERPNMALINKTERDAKFERRRYLKDELGHLNITCGWENKGGYN